MTSKKVKAAVNGKVMRFPKSKKAGDRLVKRLMAEYRRTGVLMLAGTWA